MGGILKKSFGRTKSEEEVFEYELFNDRGTKVGILNYGGIIRSINTLDREGIRENIVLSFDTVQEYESGHAYFGSIVGRTAGRIAGGKFEIDGVQFELAKNHNGNNLHGGIKGYDKVLWSVGEIIDKGEPSLSLGYISPHNEEGYPGKLENKVTYTLTEEDELIVNYRAITDRPTIVNMTNHSYFNLSGNMKRDILNHKVWIDSDRMLYVDKDTLPTGEIVSVNNVFDFRDGLKLSEGIKSNHPQIEICNGYDHPWILNKLLQEQIEVYEEESGRGMRITTDRPVVVVYSGNYLEKEAFLSGGIKSTNNLGVCFETQDYPDGINQKDFETKLITSDRCYEAYTKYSFFTKDKF